MAPRRGGKELTFGARGSDWSWSADFDVKTRNLILMFRRFQLMDRRPARLASLAGCALIVMNGFRP